MSLTIGETLGAYRIVEQLGQGGMATVFKAYHAALDRYVAIKVLHPAFKTDPNFQARFQREARVVARLEHAHIVPVYDYAEHNGAPYLVMKFIEGETLKARLLRGPVSTLDVVRFVEALGSALDYAHRQGILHRDIKPSNVMLAGDGTIYLADFGLARIAMAGESTLSTDSMLGTPQYMSPEQGRGIKDLDAGTDLYSLGVVIYELLVGQAPFHADTPFAVIHDHIYTPLPLPRALNPHLPAAVEAVLLKALAKERADRYATAQELVIAFREALAPVLSTPIVPPARTPPADPTAVTPAAYTVVGALPSAPTVLGAARPAPAAGGLAPLEPTASTVANVAAAAAAIAPSVPTPPAIPRARPARWQVVLVTGLVVAVCLGAAFIARQVGLRNNAAQPTQTAAITAASPTTPPPTAAPLDAAALLAAGLDSLAAGNLDEALTHLDAAAALDPANTAVMIRAGDALLLHGHTLGALDRYYVPASVLEQAAPSDQEALLQAHVSLAFYVLAGDETAGDFLAKQAANNPDQMLPALALHRYHIFFDEGARVEAGLQAILDDSPNNVGALLVLGDYYLSRGQEPLATRFYQRSRDVPRLGSRAALDWSELEARCNLDKLRRLRAAATLETTCADLLSLLTGK